MMINVAKSWLVSNLVPDDDLLYMIAKFPYHAQSIDDGMKYMGFYLKPNDYKKAGWRWLIGKLEKQILLWSHRWLSRAGRLVLIKSVLEAIPVYFMSLSWIPKGILEAARRLCFAYLWRGNKLNQVMSWVRWERIAQPKALGGRGLKNIFLFSKALAGKVGWRLISTTSLWTSVIYQKYITPLSMMDWIYLDNKRHLGVSIIWNVIVQSFNLVGNGLAWSIGNGHKFLVGRDSWAGGGRMMLLDEICATLLHRGYTFLY